VVYHGGSDDDEDGARAPDEERDVDAPAAADPSSTGLDGLGGDDDEDELDEAPYGADESAFASEHRAHPESRRKRLERILPEVLKRAIEKGLETGIGTLTNSRDALQGVVGKVELPKEVAGYVLSQVDETKNAMVRVVAREVREFLEAADLATELQRALTSLSFEIRTEIRFIPNDAGGVTPNVKAEVGPSRRPAARRRATRRPSAAPDPDDGTD
jgi:hypothetical protein